MWQQWTLLPGNRNATRMQNVLLVEWLWKYIILAEIAFFTWTGIGKDIHLENANLRDELYSPDFSAGKRTQAQSFMLLSADASPYQRWALFWTRRGRTQHQHKPQGWTIFPFYFSLGKRKMGMPNMHESCTTGRTKKALLFPHPQFEWIWHFGHRGGPWNREIKPFGRAAGASTLKNAAQNALLWYFAWKQIFQQGSAPNILSYFWTVVCCFKADDLVSSGFDKTTLYLMSSSKGR